jgi:hypothetical protein
MQRTSRADGEGNGGEEGRVNPTVRWLVHGVWRIAIVTILVLLVLNLVFELTN